MSRHSFDVQDAVSYGVEKAVILSNLRFWLDKVRANKRKDNIHDGYYWTYNSVTAFCDLFPYLSRGKIQRHLNSLEKDGVILSGSYNKHSYDRTKWYSMPEFKVGESINHNVDYHSSNMVNGETENNEPIPYVNPDDNPYVNPDDMVATTEEPKNEQEPKKKTQPKKKKHDFPSDFAVTETQQKKCDEYGINSQELVSQFDDFHSSKGNQFVDWSKAFNTWLNNHIKFEKLKPIAQGANYGQQQSELSHFDKLRAEAAAKYGNQQSESNAIRTVNQYDY